MDSRTLLLLVMLVQFILARLTTFATVVEVSMSQNGSGVVVVVVVVWLLLNELLEGLRADSNFDFSL